MIKFILLGKDESYFVDNISGEYQYKYDENNPNLDLVVKIDDDSILRVHHDQISREYGGTLYFDYYDDHYIINDGWDDLLLKSGYIVLNDYDKKKIDNQGEGFKIFDDLYNYIEEVLGKMFDVRKYDPDMSITKIISKNPAQSINIHFIKDGYEFNCYIDSIIRIVRKNHFRKINSLPFYPYIKEVDKFGTLYLSIFAKKIDDDGCSYKDLLFTCESFIKDLIDTFNEYAPPQSRYHYKQCNITKMINRIENESDF